MAKVLALKLYHDLLTTQNPALWKLALGDSLKVLEPSAMVPTDLDDKRAAASAFYQCVMVDAAALYFVPRPERLEHLKNTLGVLRRDARAIVSNRELIMILCLLTSDRDFAGRAWMMFDRITDEISQHMFKRRGVGHEGRQFSVGLDGDTLRFAH